MISDEIKRRIEHWARKEPLVIKAYVFGSRARADYTDESDLDIAVEIKKCPEDGAVLGTWIGVGEKMKHRLAKAIPEYKMDLQWSHEEFSKIVFDGVGESSYLIYEEDDPSAT
jgi:predicted nucleotidyltransferase